MTTAAGVDAAIAQAEQDEAARHAAIDAAAREWRPFRDQLFVAKIRATERRHGSLVVPGQGSPMGDKVERPGIRGRVVKAGPDVVDVQVGDTVFCSSHAGALMQIEPGVSILVIREADLLAGPARDEATTSDV